MFNDRELRAQMVRKGVTFKDLSAHLGINEATLYRKCKADGAFTRQEINSIIDYLEIENPMEIFFAEELT